MGSSPEAPSPEERAKYQRAYFLKIALAAHYDRPEDTVVLADDLHRFVTDNAGALCIYDIVTYAVDYFPESALRAARVLNAFVNAGIVPNSDDLPL